MFGAVAAPLGNIDKLLVIDQGGENGNNSLGRLAKVSPAVNVLLQLEAMGLDVPTVMKQLGVNPSALATPPTDQPDPRPVPPSAPPGGKR